MKLDVTITSVDGSYHVVYEFHTEVQPAWHGFQISYWYWCVLDQYHECRAEGTESTEEAASEQAKAALQRCENYWRNP